MDVDTDAGALFRVDTLSGAIETACELAEPGYALAISTDGTFYTVNGDGCLCTLGPDTGAVTVLGDPTGFSSNRMPSSMAYDHANGQLYWATADGGIVYLNADSGGAILLGRLGARAAALYAVPPADMPAPPYVPVADMTLEEPEMVVVENGARRVPLRITPFNASDRKVQWTVEDPSVAAIENDMLTGLRAGNTTAVGVALGAPEDGSVTVTLDITVRPATGDVYGFVESDMSGMADHFWTRFADSDPGAADDALADACSYELTGGEYYGGRIYGFGFSHDLASYGPAFIVVDADTYAAQVINGDFPDIRDMAFDHSQGVMYAADADTLYSVDITTGDCYAVGRTGVTLAALACDGETLYGIGEDGTLYKVDKAGGELSPIGPTGYQASAAYQSMTYDFDTGNLYWAQATVEDGAQQTSTDGLMLVDPATGKAAPLGRPGPAGRQLTALHTRAANVPATGSAVPTGIGLNSGSLVLQPGETFALKARALPASVNSPAGFGFRSGESAVATVSETGLVTAVAPGSTVITVTLGDLSAQCAVNVVGAETELYVAAPGKVQRFPLFAPASPAGTIALKDLSGALLGADYSPVDKVFYAVSTDGDLYRFGTDGSAVPVRTGTGSLAEQIAQSGMLADDAVAVLQEVAFNPFDDRLYVVAAVVDEEDPTLIWDLSLYQVDTETGAAESVCALPEDITALCFIGETQCVVCREEKDSLYTADITADVDADEMTPLIQAQGVSLGGGKAGLAYNAKLGRLFVATVDYKYSRGPVLFMADPAAGAFQKIGDAAYDTGLVDILFVTGDLNETAAPAAGPANSAAATIPAPSGSPVAREPEQTPAPAAAAAPETSPEPEAVPEPDAAPGPDADPVPTAAPVG